MTLPTLWGCYSSSAGRTHGLFRSEPFQELHVGALFDETPRDLSSQRALFAQWVKNFEHHTQTRLQRAMIALETIASVPIFPFWDFVVYLLNTEPRLAMVREHVLNGARLQWTIGYQDTWGGGLSLDGERLAAKQISPFILPWLRVLPQGLLYAKEIEVEGEIWCPTAHDRLKLVHLFKTLETRPEFLEKI